MPETQQVFWKALGKQEHKSASESQVVRVACHFNTTVRRRVRTTSSHTGENTGSSSPQGHCGTTSFNEDCYESRRKKV